AWGVPSKLVSSDVFLMFLQNLRSYPRVLGDALQPVNIDYLFCSLIAIVLLSLSLKVSDYYRCLALLVSVLIGLVSSALLYAVVGYGFAGVGVMSRTLAAQNVCFSLFVGISMMPAMVVLRSFQHVDSRTVVWRDLARKIISAILGNSAGIGLDVSRAKGLCGKPKIAVCCRKRV
ncbi:MAG: hypothetical protein JZU65_09015, partial [Chlorobium sp.]|nr:hypothetical protein [Chlorobium sp.]